jgi:secondary thiamine-phosphate synthase enzyme
MAREGTKGPLELVAPAEAAPHAGFLSLQIAHHTEYAREFVDLTDKIADTVARSGFTNGFAVVTSQHTTASIVVNESEPELLKDLDAFLDAIAPESSVYAHNAVPCPPGDHPNGHAHCQALFLSTSATVPIVNGRLSLGQWQRIFLVELDHARPRSVTLTVMGF